MSRPQILQEWSYSAILFAVLFFCCAGSAYFFPRALPLFAGLAGLLALPMAREEAEARPGMLIAFSLVAAALISSLWSPQGAELVSDPERFVGLKLTLQWVAYSGLALTALRVSPAAAERACMVLAFALLPLAAILILEGLTHAWIYQWLSAATGDPVAPDRAMRNVAQGAYVLSVLIWPAAMTLRREGLNAPVLVLAAGVVAAMVALDADAPAAALVVGGVAFALVRVFGRPAAVALAGLAASTWFAAPWLVLASVHTGAFDRIKAGLPVSWDVRLDIWAYASARIAEKPWLGWGVGAARTFSPNIHLHPHNAALQHWLELGAPGAALGGVLFGWFFWMIARPSHERSYAAAAAATLASFLVISMVSFSAWEEWWLSTGVLGMLAIILLKRFWAVEPLFEDQAGASSA